MKYILALDAGTTSIRAVLYDRKKLQIVKTCKCSFKQYFPKPGWVEHDAEEIWKVTKKVLSSCLEGVSENEVYGMGISTQRETVVAWDKRTGKPCCKAIVWQCRRTADLCNKIKLAPICEKIKEKTGLLPDAYFSATKIKWLLENDKNVQKLLQTDNLCVGTVESYLVFRLTNGNSFVSDITNASRTMLLNINTQKWDDELLAYFNIPKNILPKVVSNSEVIDTTSTLPIPVKIAGLCGDQQASLFGQGCFERGMVKNTYGTGCFILMNTASTPKQSENGLLATVAYKINNKITYALEGSVFNAGCIIDWYCKTLGLCKDVKNINDYAMRVPDNAGVYLVPAFTGLGTPYWDMEAKGTLTGLTRGTNKYHLARAVLESIAFSCHDVIQTMKEDSHIKIKELHVDGGATVNSFLMNFQASLDDCTLSRFPTESTCLGVIYLAGLATGAFKSIEELKTIIKPIQTFEPQDTKQTQKMLSGWQKAIRQCLTK